MAELETPELGYALHHHGNEMICFYLSEALGVPIEKFEKLLADGDIVGIDMCMWLAAGLRDPTLFGDDIVAARVRESVQALIGWTG